MDDKARIDDIKRKLRKLKQLEIKIRFGGRPAGNLIWDDFFDLRETGGGKAKYSLRTLASMGHESYKDVIGEYFSFVYYEIFKESGMAGVQGIYDPAVLARLGLRSDAGEDDVKKRFRELAKKYHPDAGGDAALFIALMDDYKKLTGR